MVGIWPINGGRKIARNIMRKKRTSSAQVEKLLGLLSNWYTRDSKKRELGRYFNSIDWSVLESANCEDQARLFDGLVNIGLDIIMPIKYSKLHVNDPPWVTPEFKYLIKRRQEAFTSGNKAVFNQ